MNERMWTEFDSSLTGILEGRIIGRLAEHLDAVKEKHPEWVGIFLQGSQNYNLDYEGSDIDSKLIVLPSFEDFVLNRKPHSYTHVMENEEHVDVKDIRLMFDCFRKQNINFVEILFTRYFILNPKYTKLYIPMLSIREKIGRYNNYAALNCMVGMAMEKRKALCHPYPATMQKIEQYGYDPKQLHHILRLDEFMRRWLSGVPYQDCLISEKRDELLSVKVNGVGAVEEAISLADATVAEMKQTKDQYMLNHQPQVDHDVDQVMNTVLVDLFKHNFLSEIGGAQYAA